MSINKSSSCYCVDLDIWVPFRTTSDTLFASLVLKHKFSMSMVDQILEVIRDPSFCIADLNISSAREISKRVRDFRIEEADKRLSRPTNTRHDGRLVGNIPVLVVQLVCDALARRVNPSKVVRYHLYRTKETGLPEASELLETMSLVHRTWSGPAQHALRSFPMNLNLWNIHAFSSHPWCSPGTRFIDTVLCAPPANDSCRPEQIETFDVVTSRTSTVSSLFFKSSSLTIGDIDKVIECFSRLRNLRNLRICLETTRKQEALLSLKQTGSLFITLSSLRCLEALSIEGQIVQTSRSPENVDNFFPLSPPATLKAIALGLSALPQSYLSWLLETRGDYCPEIITLTINSPQYALDVAAAIPSTLSVLKEIDILNTLEYYKSAHVVDEINATVINKCSEVTKLTIRSNSVDLRDLGNREPLTRIPITVEVLQTSGLDDLFVIKLLDSRPKPSSLQKILRHYHGTRSDFIILRNRCEETGLKLEVFHLEQALYE